MKILQVSTLYPPELNAGGTLACHDLGLELRRRGHHVQVFSGSCLRGEPPLHERDYVHDGIPVRTVNVQPGYAAGVANYRNASVADRFERFLATVRPEVVHFHSIQALGADLLGVAHRSGARIVLTMHDAWFFCAQQFLTKPAPRLTRCSTTVDAAACDCVPGLDFVKRREFLDAALANVDRIVAVSPFMRELLAANGVPAERIVLCENGIVPRPAAPRRPGRPVRFTYLGGGHPWKGSATLAEAISAVDREDVRFDLYGVTVPDWKALRGPMDRRVRCLPTFAPGDLARILAESDAVLLPSLCVESFSLVTREALHHGVPVIASRCGGPEGALRDGENGLLFDRGDADGLADAVSRFVASPELRDRLTAGARESRVRSMSEQAAQMEEIYAEGGPRRSAEPEAPLPGSVLFVAGMDGAPFRYRVTHLQEQLDLLGVRSSACFFRDERALREAGEHDVVVLNRVPWDAYVERVVARARAAGALLVFAIDDYVFDPELPIPALETLPEETVTEYRKGQRLFLKTLQACDAFLGSTGVLARAASALGKPAFVHENSMSRRLLEISAREHARRAARPPGKVRVGYFSGTNSHDRDFALVAPALRELMQARPEVELVLGGPVALPEELAALEPRVDRLPFVPWQELPALLAGIDVNLAPIEHGVLFCEAKSALKYFEAAAVGLPTIASPTAPFRDAIRHGENGFLASSGEEWLRLLLRLVDDAAERTRAGEAARAEVVERYSPEAYAPRLGETFRALLRLRPAAALKPLPPLPDDTFERLRGAGMPIGDAALEPRDGLPGVAQLGVTGVTRQIRGSTRAVQPFFCDGTLYRIDVQVATYRRVHRHDITLKLLDVGSGAELARATRDAELACDNYWLSFTFDPVATQHERELQFVLEAPGAGRGEGLAVYCGRSGWPRGRGRCGEDGGFDLVFRTWLLPPGARPLAARRPGEEDRPAEELAAMALRRVAELEERLERAERRLAVRGGAKGRSGWHRVEELAAATAAREALKRVRAALRDPPEGPTLPYRALRRAFRAVRPDADALAVEMFMMRLQRTRAYGAGRAAYRRLRGLPE